MSEVLSWNDVLRGDRSHTKGEPLGVGLVGSGFMGRAHAFAYRQVPGVFSLPVAITLRALADRNRETAEKAATDLGFERAYDDWRTLIEDADVHIISITAPNAMHMDIALSALEAGKHVWCEKPLACNLHDTRKLASAAAETGLSTAVGFNYLQNPLLHHAKAMIDAGELGRITHFRGIHAEDYMHDPETPWTFRCDAGHGGGVLMDLGSHILSLVHFLLGNVAQVQAQMHTIIAERPDPVSGQRRSVEVDDVTRLWLDFENGATGSIEASWISTGKSMDLSFEVYGESGSILFSQERMNEMKVLRRTKGGRSMGYETIVMGTDHPPYASFCPASGHQLGFNDLKVMEAAAFLGRIGGDHRYLVDFEGALPIQTIIDAAKQSHVSGQPVPLSAMDLQS